MNHLSWTKVIPQHWSTKPLRALSKYAVSSVDKLTSEDELPVRLCNYTDVYSNEFITLDMDFMQATANESETAKFGLAVDDVIITKDSESWDDIGIPALVRETAPDLVCGYHLALVRPDRKKMLGSFLFRCIQSKLLRVQLELASNGVTRFGLPKSDIGALILPVPPLPEQEVIAEYLDRETARIDALLNAKERLLELQVEKRRSLIRHAITRGLGTNSLMRDSGIPWLDEIPAHWKTVRLRFLVDRIEQGWSPESENREPNFDEWGVLKLNAVSHGRFDDSAAKALPATTKCQPDLEVQTGDLLITRSNTPHLVGDACFVDSTRPRLMLCDLIYRLTLRFNLIDGHFLTHFLIIPEGRAQIETDARGTSASMVKISQEHIKDWWIPLPPLKEQKTIVSWIEKQVEVLDKITTATERTIALLHEHRDTLIAAAVTGQLDPRNVHDRHTS